MPSIETRYGFSELIPYLEWGDLAFTRLHGYRVLVITEDALKAAARRHAFADQVAKTAWEELHGPAGQD